MHLTETHQPNTEQRDGRRRRGEGQDRLRREAGPDRAGPDRTGPQLEERTHDRRPLPRVVIPDQVQRLSGPLRWALDSASLRKADSITWKDLSQRAATSSSCSPLVSIFGRICTRMVPEGGATTNTRRSGGEERPAAPLHEDDGAAFTRVELLLFPEVEAAVGGEDDGDDGHLEDERTGGQELSPHVEVITLLQTTSCQLSQEMRSN
ncbi:hypothetical protein EYF80_062754 [Liparis tanakae]|uniref:Uncharacterized protein n=1 Tax=Liparis tanakae TaxID=230148 RepID=A0A4Z2EFL6_9TELE|nr:hypothetical protein EYF80_062754 [Liparis tanakae]